MADERPTAKELAQLMAHLLAGEVGGSEPEWLTAIGPVIVHPIAFRPRCNWSIDPAGSPDQLQAIDKMFQLLSAEHPYARPLES